MSRSSATTGSIWARLLSRERLSGAIDPDDSPRTSFQRDYDRIVYSSAFRRLGDKTQVYPLPHDDNVHNRLTHSLEVATVGRSLGTLVGRRLDREAGSLPAGLDPRDIGDCVAAACLAHDLGNPPFGHVGEQAIREVFAERRAGIDAVIGEDAALDLVHFEGNAQSLRLALSVAQPAAAHGLDLTCATLAALVKYPCLASAAHVEGDGPRPWRKHGVCLTEREAFATVAARVGMEPVARDAWRRHPLAFVTEAADDIAYTLIDLEDGYRLGLVGGQDLISLLRPLTVGEAAAPAETQPAREREAMLELAGRFRGAAVNRLVREAAEVFVAGRAEIVEGRFEGSLVDHIESRGGLREIRNTNVSRCYRSRSVLKMEMAGAAAIQGVLRALLDAVREPGDVRGRHLKSLLPGVLGDRDPLYRVVDHVSGMTDTYVVRLYRELTGMRLPGGRDL